MCIFNFFVTYRQLLFYSDDFENMFHLQKDPWKGLSVILKYKSLSIQDNDLPNSVEKTGFIKNVNNCSNKQELITWD